MPPRQSKRKKPEQAVDVPSKTESERSEGTEKKSRESKSSKATGRAKARAEADAECYNQDAEPQRSAVSACASSCGAAVDGSDAPDYTEMTVSQLQSLLKERGVDIKPLKKKAELVARLTEPACAAGSEPHPAEAPAAPAKEESKVSESEHNMNGVVSEEEESLLVLSVMYLFVTYEKSFESTSRGGYVHVCVVCVCARVCVCVCVWKEAALGVRFISVPLIRRKSRCPRARFPR